MKDYDLLTGGNKSGPMKDLGISDKVLLYIYLSERNFVFYRQVPLGAVWSSEIELILV